MPADALTVDLWYWQTEGLDVEAVGSIERELSDAERARAARFVFDRDRRDYVAAHALLRMALSEAVPRPATAWQFEATPGGKPRLVVEAGDPPPPSFNLTHTAGLVACVVCRDGREVGIDAEGVKPRTRGDEVARRMFEPAEVGALLSLPHDAQTERFVDLWTLKEAYVKGLGTGLWQSVPERLAFEFDASGALRHSSASSRWQFALLALARHRVAVAVQGREDGGPWVLVGHAVGATASLDGVRSTGRLTLATRAADLPLSRRGTLPGCDSRPC